MSGIEEAIGAGAVGAGKAVAKAVGNALETQDDERELLLKLAEKSGEYEPAARAYVRRQVVKQQVLLKIWQPLGRLFGFSREYFELHFADDMAERLKDVPEEEIVTPRGAVAGPAVLGLGFTVEEPQLRAMYLNLLATAADKRVAQSAHPAFAEVIRQLDAEEARVLAQVTTPDIAPIIEIRVNSRASDRQEEKGFVVEATHVLNWMQVDEDDPDAAGHQVALPERAAFVDNWIRLGLVTVDYTQHLIHEPRYSWADTTPLVVQAREQYDTEDLKRVECERGILKVTDFGRAFHRAVIGRCGTKQLEAAAESDTEQLSADE